MIKMWFLATRPWSFTAAFTPIALGTVLAWSDGTFNLWLFLLSLLGGICMQAGTNLINTYGDYLSGVDTLASAKTCPQLVTGMVMPETMKTAGLLIFSIAGIIGILLSYLRGWEILAFGVVGLLGGYCYTAGISPYKYKGWGPLFVFFLMGPLMAWPAYFIQTGQHSLIPVIASLPISFLVTGILHANDIRDIVEDRRAGITTMAIRLGFQKSVSLYCALYLGAYVSLFFIVAIGILPWSAVLPFALAPVVLKTLREVNQADRSRFSLLQNLEAVTAQFHFQFGLLLLLGLLLSIL